MKGAISYRITITAVVERVEKVGKTWERVNATPDSKYDYTPEIEKTVQRSVEIYDQAMDTLDVWAVIKAANGATP